MQTDFLSDLTTRTGTIFLFPFRSSTADHRQASCLGLLSVASSFERRADDILDGGLFDPLDTFGTVDIDLVLRATEADQLAGPRLPIGKELPVQ